MGIGISQKALHYGKFSLFGSVCNEFEPRSYRSASTISSKGKFPCLGRIGKQLRLEPHGLIFFDVHSVPGSPKRAVRDGGKFKSSVKMGLAEFLESTRGGCGGHCSKLLLEAGCPPQESDKLGSNFQIEVGSYSRARNDIASFIIKEITCPGKEEELEKFGPDLIVDGFLAITKGNSHFINIYPKLCDGLLRNIARELRKSAGFSSFLVLVETFLGLLSSFLLDGNGFDAFTELDSKEEFYKLTTANGGEFSVLPLLARGIRVLCHLGVSLLPGRAQNRKYEAVLADTASLAWTYLFKICFFTNRVSEEQLFPRLNCFDFLHEDSELEGKPGGSNLGFENHRGSIPELAWCWKLEQRPGTTLGYYHGTCCC
ncbi:hypothetical protein Tco_1563895 [Tanacetum coccineum]